jgi:hypothetical protein
MGYSAWSATVNHVPGKRKQKRLRPLASRARPAYGGPVNFSDDYRANLELWARHPRVTPLPPGPVLPPFPAQKFSSHQEFYRWKKARILNLARKPAAQE